MQMREGPIKMLQNNYLHVSIHNIEVQFLDSQKSIYFLQLVMFLQIFSQTNLIEGSSSWKEGGQNWNLSLASNSTSFLNMGQ